MSLPESYGLKDKVTIITGGGQGIGFAIAKLFAQAGSDIIIAGRNEKTADGIREVVEAEGRRFFFIKTDVTNEEQVIAMAQKAKEEFGHIDVLVNNVGISKHEDAEKMPLEMWNLVINTNLTSQFLVSREVGKIMLEQGKGSIVNISSMSGSIVNRPITQCNYNTAKAGVNHLTKSMAVEWATRGVRVNAVAPAYVYTPITAHRIDNPDDPYVPTWNYMNPMGRVGLPEEIAGAALYFACDASSYTTGAILPVDGGYTCW